MVEFLIDVKYVVGFLAFPTVVLIVFYMMYLQKMKSMSHVEMVKKLNTYPWMVKAYYLSVGLVFIFMALLAPTNECPFTGRRSGFPNLMFCSGEYVRLLFIFGWSFAGLYLFYKAISGHPLKSYWEGKGKK